MFLKIRKILKKTTVPESLFNKVAGLRPQACNLVKKETLAQVFPCEICEIFKNTFFHRAPSVAASEHPNVLTDLMLLQACLWKSVARGKSTFSHQHLISAYSWQLMSNFLCTAPCKNLNLHNEKKVIFVCMYIDMFS